MAAPVSISRILAVLRKAADVLKEFDEPWAVIGGIAVSVRSQPRFTQDVDLAIDVADDAAAESVVHRLSQHGYRVLTAIEHKTAGRLATVRLLPRDEAPDGVIVDLLFASSGIEREVVAAADGIEIIPGLYVPIARKEHLIAMKVLSAGPRRRHDAPDLGLLLDNISPTELARAREAIALIEARGFNRGKALNAVLDEFIASLE